jgi:hypothetical protein
MTAQQQISPTVADEILADLRGAAYYQDPRRLAEFLDGRYGERSTPEKAADVADAILADFRGAAYYKDPKILADFLKASFERG